MFNDEIDGLDVGKNDDMYYRVGAGLNIYFTQPKTKFNEQRRIDLQKRKEHRQLKKINTQTLKSNRRTKRLGSDEETLKNESTILKTEPEIKAPTIGATGKLIDQKEQRKLNIKTIKENRRTKRLGSDEETLKK